MRRIIQYAEDLDSGLVVSRVGREFAWPILQYDKIGEGGDFTKPFEYELERVGVFSTGPIRLRHTRKIPTTLKNTHRKFWGMPLLKEDGR